MDYKQSAISFVYITSERFCLFTRSCSGKEDVDPVFFLFPSEIDYLLNRCRKKRQVKRTVPVDWSDYLEDLICCWWGGERSSRIHQQLYTRWGVQSVADVFATHSAWEPPNREILSSSSIVSAAPQVLLLVRWVLMAMLTSKDDHRTFPPYNAVGAQWCGQRVGFSLMTLWPVSLYALYLYTYLPTARPTSSLYRITFENLFL